jgi:glycosyltransferase involved in cell wall biosynthesis
MTNYANRPVFMIAAFPPPIHGAAVITAMMAEAVAARSKVIILNIAPDALRRGLRYHLTRIFRVVSAFTRVAAGGVGGNRGAIYLTTAGGLGNLYNIALALEARLLARSLYIHHHSFAYIDRRDWKMSLLARVAGPRACHLMLCPAMERRLRSKYRTVAHTRVLSNAAFYQPPAEPTARRVDGARLRVGFLSNLHRDKGLDLVFATAAAGGDTIERLVLAGAPIDRNAEAMIAAAAATLGTRLDNRGVVYGEAKARFFAEIDVFLFPSRYANESEPLVVYEALSAGVPVIAYSRGCIACQLPTGAGLIIEPDDDFVAAACAQIKRWSQDVHEWGLASRRALEGMRAAHERSRAALAEVVAGFGGERD